MVLIANGIFFPLRVGIKTLTMACLVVTCRPDTVSSKVIELVYRQDQVMAGLLARLIPLDSTHRF